MVPSRETVGVALRGCGRLSNSTAMCPAEKAVRRKGRVRATQLLRVPATSAARLALQTLICDRDVPSSHCRAPGSSAVCRTPADRLPASCTVLRQISSILVPICGCSCVVSASGGYLRGQSSGSVLAQRQTSLGPTSTSIFGPAQIYWSLHIAQRLLLALIDSCASFAELDLATLVSRAVTV